MSSRFMRALNQPLSRKLQHGRLVWSKFKTRYAYGCRMRACGRGSIVQRPLFWTPEFVSMGEAVLIWPGSRIEGVQVAQGESASTPHIVFGDGVTMEQNCHITAGGVLTIGAGCTILFDVMITDIDHRYEDFGRRVIDQPMDVLKTQLGSNCFVGSGARILAGTTLGDGCVVGANAVVRGDFPKGAVIAGIPARIIKRYDPAMNVWSKVTGSE